MYYFFNQKYLTKLFKFYFLEFLHISFNFTYFSLKENLLICYNYLFTKFIF